MDPEKWQKAFIAQLREALSKEGRGAQTDLAQRMGMHRSVVSDLVNDRRQLGLEKQHEVAQAFGFDLVDWIKRGEALIDGREHFPYGDVLENVAGRREQAREIILRVNRELGLHPLFDSCTPDILEEYAEGTISAADFHRGYRAQALEAQSSLNK